jgi:hypothetical protein
MDEELRNVLNAARAILGRGLARLRQPLVETLESIRDDLANCFGKWFKAESWRRQSRIARPRLAIRATSSDWPRLYLYPVPVEADL